jgi:hypothetical protein
MILPREKHISLNNATQPKPSRPKPPNPPRDLNTTSNAMNQESK